MPASLARTRFDRLLDAGPQNDVTRIYERIRRGEIHWVSNIQTFVLDTFLKANSVPEGVRSYSRIVVLAAGTRATWDRFR